MMDNRLIEESVKFLGKRSYWNSYDSSRDVGKLREDLNNYFVQLNESEVTEDQLVEDLVGIINKYDLPKHIVEEELNEANWGWGAIGSGLLGVAKKFGKPLLTKGKELVKKVMSKFSGPKTQLALGLGSGLMVPDSTKDAVIDKGKEIIKKGADAITGADTEKKPETAAQSAKSMEPSDAEKSIASTNKELERLGKKGLGTGSQTKTYSQRRPDGPNDKYEQEAKRKTDEFLAKRDAELVKKLQNIEKRK